MVLFEAEVETTTRTGAGTPPRSAAAYLASMRKRFPVSGVTFLKTLVSDYQILSPVRSFACTLVQQSSKYKPMTFFRPFVMRFLPYSSLSTADVDFF
jgi:hypothetical protein